MTSKDFNLLLLDNYPVIKDDFNKYVSRQDGIETGSFLVVEDVFMKYIFKELEQNNLSEIEKFVNFIEMIYKLDDEYAQNVIVIGVLENLKSSEYSLMIRDYLLPCTKNEFDSIEL